MDLSKMERTRIPSVRGAPAPAPAPAPPPGIAALAREVVVAAHRLGVCAICGGGGWVHEHDMDCPVERLGEALGMRKVSGNCAFCGEPYKFVYIQKPIRTDECGRCYMDRSRGRAHVESQARAAVAAAKSAPKATAKVLAANAKRLIAIMKDFK
jgi:hypothetical protein